MNIPLDPTPENAFMQRKKQYVTSNNPQHTRLPKDKIMVRAGVKDQALFSGDMSAACDNRGRHSTAKCIGLVSGNGEVVAFPRHGARDHTFDECKHEFARTDSSVMQYVFRNRQAKPPLASRFNASLELDDSLLPDARPLSRAEVQQVLLK